MMLEEHLASLEAEIRYVLAISDLRTPYRSIASNIYLDILKTRYAIKMRDLEAQEPQPFQGTRFK